MSLSVSLIKINPVTGEIINAEKAVNDGSDLAGFESWRKTVYGADPVIFRGATFLPQLKSSDLIIEGSDLYIFRAELNMLINDLDDLSRDLNQDIKTLSSRFNNILNSIESAIEKGLTVWLS